MTPRNWDRVYWLLTVTYPVWSVALALLTMPLVWLRRVDVRPALAAAALTLFCRIPDA